MTISLPWKTGAVAFALLAAAVFLWNREHGLRGDAQRDAEAARLALKNQIVEGEASKKELAASVSDLLAQNKALAAAFDDAMAAAPDAKPASASRLDTGPLEVKGRFRPPGAPDPAAAGALSDAARAGHTGSGTAPQDPCVLRPGDAVSVTVDSIELRTGKGNTMVVGAASVYREIPPPRELLAQGRFQSALSTSRELAVQIPPRWGALALGACGAQGCGPGVGVLLPPVTLPLVGWRAEGVLGLVAAPGALLAIGGIGVRW